MLPPLESHTMRAESGRDNNNTTATTLGRPHSVGLAIERARSQSDLSDPIRLGPARRGAAADSISQTCV
jgi:hypothetical protein